MSVTLASYLGPNTESILEDVAIGLRSAGVDAVVVDPPDLATNPPDLAWACGLLTVEVIAAGGALTVVAAPIFAGETNPVYRSVVVTRAERPTGVEPRSGFESGGADPVPSAGLASVLGTRLAVNEYRSWSGCHAVSRELALRGLRFHLADAFTEVVVTGSHVDSIRAVAERSADVAAIDHTVWGHVCATEPTAVAGLVVIDQTRDWPAPPFSVSLAPTSTAARSLTAVLAHLAPPGLTGMRPATVDDYRFMLT